MEAGLVNRLEVAVARLETLTGQQKPNLAPKPAMNVPNAGMNQNEPPPAIKQYDESMENELNSFYDLCSQIGGPVSEMAMKLKAVFDAHRAFVWYAAGRTEPTDSKAVQGKLAPIFEQVQAMANFKESQKNTATFNHLAAVAEGVQAVGWVTVKPTPAPYVKEMLDCSMFFVNRVRTNNKDKKIHADWCNAWCAIFNSLQKYIKQNHTTGLVWNSSPGANPPDSTANRVVKSSTNLNGSGGPPAPPPPPPPGIFGDLSGGGDAGGKKTGEKSDRQALFAEINKGEGITSGLKKVTADMQTHKNPNLRVSSNVPASSAEQKKAAAAAAAAAVDKPPKIELKDHKVWQIEFQKNNDAIVVETDKKQAVYIYKCENSVVQIKGKVNSVTVDGCKKTSVVVDNLLAQIEVINSRDVKVQTLGTLPTISIQKTDGCQVYLSKESLTAEIVTSKSSEMNVSAPNGEDGEFIEYPIPEQFKTTLNLAKRKLITVVSDIV